MTSRWVSLALLAAAVIGWNVFVWTAPDPPDVGGAGILILGLLALVIIYANTSGKPRGK